MFLRWSDRLVLFLSCISYEVVGVSVFAVLEAFKGFHPVLARGIF